MNNAKTSNETGAWVFYDGDCPICCRWMDRIRTPLARHGFQFAPQQSEFAQRTLALKPGEVLPEMKVLTAEGNLLGGADAALHIARFIWWAKPMRLLAKLPGGLPLMRRMYRWFAARRHCVSGNCNL